MEIKKNPENHVAAAPHNEQYTHKTNLHHFKLMSNSGLAALLNSFNIATIITKQ